MTTSTAPHRQSISDLLDAPMPGAATFRTKASAPPWAAAEVPTAPPVEVVKLPEPRVSKQTFARQVGMSVRWVEQKIAAGMPCEYVDGRPRLRVTEGEDWLRSNGHLTTAQTRTRPGA